MIWTPCRLYVWCSADCVSCLNDGPTAHVDLCSVGCLLCVCRWTSRRPAGRTARSARSTLPIKWASTRRERIPSTHRVCCTDWMGGIAWHWSNGLSWFSLAMCWCKQINWNWTVKNSSSPEDIPLTWKCIHSGSLHSLDEVLHSWMSIWLNGEKHRNIVSRQLGSSSVLVCLWFQNTL